MNIDGLLVPCNNDRVFDFLLNVHGVVDSRNLFFLMSLLFVLTFLTCVEKKEKDSYHP